MLESIIASCPKEVDLTNDEHADKILETVETLLESGLSLQDIENMEDRLISQNDPSLIFVLLCLKIARSSILASQKLTRPLFISVVFAVYKEHNRIRKKSEHPHGEDFLLKKVRQLEWLFGQQPTVDWELIIVDDGCPDGSGKIAERIIAENELQDKAKVLFLADAIERNHPATQNLLSTRDSQKGGSIVYGMWDAVERHGPTDHIVVYTDADLSTHLGQLMLLVDPLLNGNSLAAIGSRREPDSVVIKKGTRNKRGKLFIYLWKRLIPNLGAIVDTQCGFKAFSAELVPHLTSNLIEKKFAFDIELLLKTEQRKKESITKVPIAWIDSEAASTTTDLQPYLPMLRSIVRMNKKYFPPDERSNEFAEFIDGLDDQDFQAILGTLPADIVDRNPEEFTAFDGVRPEDLTT